MIIVSALQMQVCLAQFYFKIIISEIKSKWGKNLKQCPPESQS